MTLLYQEIIDFMLISGKRIRTLSGNILDIGIKKQYLTTEDLNIERGLKNIILNNKPSHFVYAEEENEIIPKFTNDVWVIDPISGTKTFIQGLPHYGIVVSHISNGIIQFGAVYDPSAEELFTAYNEAGAFLNGKRIFVSEENDIIVLNISSSFANKSIEEKVMTELKDKPTVFNTNSHAVNLCHFACGRFGGNITLAKDSFPIFAGGIICREARGMFKNFSGFDSLDFNDRMFWGGNQQNSKILSEITLKLSSQML